VKGTQQQQDHGIKDAEPSRNVRQEPADLRGEKQREEAGE
jgi:hypothetical protein